ncbi:MAG: adenosylcobinamide-phosphate synthase CbiB [Pseudomonadota bacterium]
MVEASALILLVALVLDWFLGEPEIVWSRFPHPVVAFGKLVSLAEKNFNHATDDPALQYRKGSLAIALLIGVALIAGAGLALLTTILGPIGWVIEAAIVFVLLAQKSLYDHVSAVANGLRDGGIEGGRQAVAMIVGRDPDMLDETGICRAAIESLAENFSDGVVAPAFWYLVFGLPGIMVYKMINTADSMIAYRSEQYLWFGRTTAQIDDLANWIPARLSAGLIAAGAGAKFGLSKSKYSFDMAMRDAGLHRSPNAGWPEGAIAGALDIALGGPREYGDQSVAQSHINASGKADLRAEDILRALEVFRFTCFALWAFVLIIAILF